MHNAAEQLHSIYRRGSDRPNRLYIRLITRGLMPQKHAPEANGQNRDQLASIVGRPARILKLPTKLFVALIDSFRWLAFALPGPSMFVNSGYRGCGEYGLAPGAAGVPPFTIGHVAGVTKGMVSLHRREAFTGLVEWAKCDAHGDGISRSRAGRRHSYNHQRGQNAHSNFPHPAHMLLLFVSLEYR